MTTSVSALKSVMGVCPLKTLPTLLLERGVHIVPAEDEGESPLMKKVIGGNERRFLFIHSDSIKLCPFELFIAHDDDLILNPRLDLLFREGGVGEDQGIDLFMNQGIIQVGQDRVIGSARIRIIPLAGIWIYMEYFLNMLPRFFPNMENIEKTILSMAIVVLTIYVHQPHRRFR